MKICEKAMILIFFFLLLCGAAYTLFSLYGDDSEEAGDIINNKIPVVIPRITEDDSEEAGDIMFSASIFLMAGLPLFGALILGIKDWNELYKDAYDIIAIVIAILIISGAGWIFYWVY
ncbi:MAG: hypothetical protein J7J93_03045 [Candidatus Aenigmarchaeota archaeon]|nr:hypothetical protein [Candidatus Aenigmarchaeota archaeon]